MYIHTVVVGLPAAQHLCVCMCAGRLRARYTEIGLISQPAPEPLCIALLLAWRRVAAAAGDGGVHIF